MPVARFNRLSAALAATAPTPLQARKALSGAGRAQSGWSSARAWSKTGWRSALLRTAAQMLSQVARETLPRLIRPGRRETDVAG